MTKTATQQNIPKGWQRVKLGDNTIITSGFPFSSARFNDEGKGLPLIRIRDLQRGLIQTYYDGPYDKAYIVKKGDVLVGMDGDFYVVRWSNENNGLLNQRICKLEAKEGLDLSFLYYLLSVRIKEIQKTIAATTVKHLSINHIRAIEEFAPPVSEQKKIAEILGAVDEEIQKTDEIIAATEKLKRGLMQRLFTQGIRHTKFKRAENGQVPQEWKVLNMADAIDFQEGPGILAKDFHADGVPLIRLEGLTSQSLLNGCNYLDPSLVERKWSHFRLRKGDILLSSSASLGRVATVDDEAVGSIAYTGIIRFRPKDGSVIAPYIKYFLTSPNFSKLIGGHGTGSTIRHFGPSHLKLVSIALPKVGEQKEISDILSLVDQKLMANQKAREGFAMLKKGLMQDLLSGKVRTNN